jgi:hypothetical protein
LDFLEKFGFFRIFIAFLENFGFFETTKAMDLSKFLDFLEFFGFFGSFWKILLKSQFHVVYIGRT